MTTCGSTSPNGPAAGTPTRVDGGSRTATSAPSTPPGPTGGSSATAPAAPTSTATPGHRSSGTHRSRQVLTRRSCPGPLLGRPEAQEQTPAAGPVLGTAYSRPTRTLPGLRAAAAAHRPATRLPQPVGAVVPHGAQGLDPPRSDPRQPPDDPPSRAHLLHPQPHQRAQQDHPDNRRSRAALRLLEPCAATSGTHGSGGAPAQQCAGATRQLPALGPRRDRGRGPLQRAHRPRPSGHGRPAQTAINIIRLR